MLTPINMNMFENKADGYKEVEKMLNTYGKMKRPKINQDPRLFFKYSGKRLGEKCMLAHCNLTNHYMLLIYLH